MADGRLRASRVLRMTRADSMKGSGTRFHRSDSCYMAIGRFLNAGRRRAARTASAIGLQANQDEKARTSEGVPSRRTCPTRKASDKLTRAGRGALSGMPRCRAVLSGIHMLADGDWTGRLGRRDSNLCILESVFAQALSPGARTRICASRIEPHFLQTSQAPDRRLHPVEAR
jgi:hypothetical protein